MAHPVTLTLYKGVSLSAASLPSPYDFLRVMDGTAILSWSQPFGYFWLNNHTRKYVTTCFAHTSRPLSHDMHQERHSSARVWFSYMYLRPTETHPKQVQ